jgi:hypothetical protein
MNKHPAIIWQAKPEKENLPAAPHGICSTLKDQINEDLLAFFKQ